MKSNVAEKAADKIAHTPGPWRAIWSIVKQHPKHPVWGWFVSWDRGNSRICEITRQPRWTMSEEGEAEANARLIAAAPELLELLRCTMCWIRTDTADGASLWEQARAAISKSGGKLESIACLRRHNKHQRSPRKQR